MAENQTSGLRVEEILADYFVKKEITMKTKSDDEDEKSFSKESSRHQHKHKKKSKRKHKRERGMESDNDSDSRSSHKHRKHSDESRKQNDHKHHKDSKSKRESSSEKRSGKRKHDELSKSDSKSSKITAIPIEKPEDPISKAPESGFMEMEPPKNDLAELIARNLSASIETVNSVSNGSKCVNNLLWTPISEVKVELPASVENKPYPLLIGEINTPSEPIIKLKDERSGKTDELKEKVISKEIQSQSIARPTLGNIFKMELDLAQITALPSDGLDIGLLTKPIPDLEEGELVDDPKEIVNAKECSGEDEAKKKKGHKHKVKKRKKSLGSLSPDRKHGKSSISHKSSHHGQSSASGERKDTRDSYRIMRLKRSRSRSPDRKALSSRYSSRRSQSFEQPIDSSRKPSRSPVRRVRDLRERIDKKQLLEIARKNVLEMIEAGTLPQGTPVANLQPQQLASIKAGGKSVQELTDFCKALSEKHKAYISSDSDDDRRPPPTSDDEDAPFIHHPFKSKEAQPMIRMNIRNAIQLPLRTTAEKTADSVKLRQQFPVSSGNQHRTKELEWVPVEKTEKKPAAATTKKQVPKAAPLAIEAPPAEPVLAPPPTVVEPEPFVPPVEPADSVFVRPPSPKVDIGTIMADRLNAMRKLQENPHDMQALSKMYHAQQLMQNWAQSKMQPGQFGHSVTNRLLTPEELNGPYPVWARKDQLTSATPVQGGIGMHLLKKMGWNPGEGLGKNKEGSLIPLMLDVKTDKKGLVSNTEAQKSARPLTAKVTHDLSGKHPVSALMELCSKRKWGAPDYTLLDETGPDHRKNFLFKVKVKGVDYQPSVSSASKKQAKALAATVCLQAIGLIPRDLSNPL